MTEKIGTLKVFLSETGKLFSNVQGRNERKAGGHNSPGAESLWGCRITEGGRRKPAEGAEKTRQCHKYFLQ